MIEFVTQLLGQNDFLQGGMLLMAVGAVLAYLRKVPMQIINLIKRRYTQSIEVRDPVVFSYLEEWLSDQQYGRKSKRLSVSGVYIKDEYVLVFAPGRGSHFFKYKDRWFWLQREKDDPNSKGGSSGTDDIAALFTKEYFALNTYGRDTTLLKSILEEATEKARVRRKEEVSIYYNTPWGEWSLAAQAKHRSLESVILTAGQKELIQEDMRSFYEKEEWYAERGIPYRRGYLLSGPPGNGKSSLVKALASAFNKNLYVLNLASSTFNDEKLLRAVHTTQPGSIILIEDIDAAFVQREKGDGGEGLTFSGLLNALDGVVAQEGRVVFMTTNHIERLDPALIRDGRCDLKVHVGYADEEQARQMFLRFYPGRPELANVIAEEVRNGEFSVAELQNHFLMHPNATDSVIQFAKKLLKAA